MQKIIMFEDVPEACQVMFPNGEIKTKDEVKAKYPILGTNLGVIGITTGDDGTLGELIMMGRYDNINQLVDIYREQGAEFTPEMTNAEKCEVITEFINNPVTEGDAALDAFLSM